VRVDQDAFDGQTLRSRAYTGNASDEELTRVIRDDIIIPPPPPPIGQTLLTVQKLADRGEAHPGEQVNYTITVRNLSNVPAQGITVEDTFPTYQMTIVDPASGIVNGGSIIWNIPTLGPSEVRTITVRAQLAWNLAAGSTVQNTVRVSALGMLTPVNGFATIQIPNRSPITGANDFSGTLENTSMFLRPITGGTSASGGAGFLSIVISMAGVAAGGFFSRRYFL
jgi:uncharacterized repeat protein (TIGR01451 family)